MGIIGHCKAAAVMKEMLKMPKMKRNGDSGRRAHLAAHAAANENPPRNATIRAALALPRTCADLWS